MQSKKNSLFSIIAASSVGTMIEWYDFYIFGSLSSIIASKFFPVGNPTVAFLSTLATFAAGFIVRPFGALFFGRLGDIIGRKYTFMVTLVLMGFATFFIGCIPSYETIGFWAPLLVLLLRLLQGLALGGEYGGAATYVAEHSPNNKRGLMTSWIQITATAGLIISLLVIMLTRNILSANDFNSWGWRIPFWVSILMVGVSYIIRKNMHESPLFAKAKSEGKTTNNPLKESFGNKYNFKYVLLALFGAVMGQGVIWYTSQFYALSFLEKTVGIEKNQVDTIMFIALLLATPFFVFWGWISDKIGRKNIILAGMLIAVLTMRFLFDGMYKTTNFDKTNLLTTTTNATIKSINTTSFDSVFTTTNTYKNNITEILTVKNRFENFVPKLDDKGKAITEKSKSITVNNAIKWKLILYVFILVFYVTMVYGPIAAFLVELFPTRIRYTSMSLPYHIGNGVFGGLMPFVATYLTTIAKQNPTNTKWYLNGLWYPIAIASISFIIGAVYLKNKDNRIDD